MKIVVFSDSHGLGAPMLDVVRAESPDEVFFLGDGLADLDYLRRERPGLAVSAVAGNCDLSGQPLELVVQRDGIRFLLTHGHSYLVKMGPGGLLAQARRLGVDVALFGHTHRPFCEQADGLWLMNPGSIGSLCSPHYGVILLENGGVTCYTDANGL